MSDRKQALQDLLAKVEVGNIPDTGVDRFSAIPRRGGGVYADPNWYDANAAYWRGSLDAAKALHDAVLPEWHVEIEFHGEGWTPSAGARVSQDVAFLDGHSAMDDSPARAWLCAILKALIAEADT